MPNCMNIINKILTIDHHIITTKFFITFTGLSELRLPTAPHSSATDCQQGRMQGGGGAKTPTLSLIFYKNFITCAKEITCFRILLACQFVGLLQYHGMNLHANFKEHCEWDKK